MSIFSQDHLLFPEILWKRPQNIYKRQCGKIIIIAGSRSMAGAASLTCEAAFRAGAGIVLLGFPDELKEVYKKVLPETMSVSLASTPSGSISLSSYKKIIELASDVDLVAIGPGLSRNNETATLVQKLVKGIKKPLILDADGLNALIGKTNILSRRKEPTIITPHPGEAGRLINKRPVEINKNRLKITQSIASNFRAIVVLKGHETVIAEPKGRIIINKTGGPELATAGSGDVLLGIISTFCAQNLTNLFKATAVADYLHGLAGNLASQKIGERSVIASDIIKFLPKAIKKAEKEL
jgi:ADP-dependent NAD(P)H-hydrate dehydratase / NAD(P)H-hydrate epimerase